LIALFAGFLALKVAGAPLTDIIILVMLMCLYDCVRSIREE
jgi:hypothetical protein